MLGLTAIQSGEVIYISPLPRDLWWWTLGHNLYIAGHMESWFTELLTGGPDHWGTQPKSSGTSEQ